MIAPSHGSRYKNKKSKSFDLLLVVTRTRLPCERICAKPNLGLLCTHKTRAFRYVMQNKEGHRYDCTLTWIEV